MLGPGTDSKGSTLVTGKNKAVTVALPLTVRSSEGGGSHKDGAGYVLGVRIATAPIFFISVYLFFYALISVPLLGRERSDGYPVAQAGN